MSAEALEIVMENSRLANRADLALSMAANKKQKGRQNKSKVSALTSSLLRKKVKGACCDFQSSNGMVFLLRANCALICLGNRC